MESKSGPLGLVSEMGDVAGERLRCPGSGGMGLDPKVRTAPIHN